MPFTLVTSTRKLLLTTYPGPVWKSLPAYSVVRQRKNRKEEAIQGLEIPASAEEYEILKDAMSAIDPALAALLNLSYNNGYECSEIARMQGKATGTIYWKLNVARRQLRKQIRIQEKEREAQKAKYQRDRRPGLA